MAKDTTLVTGEAAPKKRKTGPRTKKPVQVIVMYEGDLVGDLQFVFDPFEAMDKKEANPNLKMKKVVIPQKTAPKPAAA